MDDIDYLFAFLHGVIHPLVLMLFVRKRVSLVGLSVATGLATLTEYWLLLDRLGWSFPRTKAVLALTTSLAGFTWVLGLRPGVCLLAVLVGLGVAGYSQLALGWRNTFSVRWVLLAVVVLGQLAIYLVGFLATRWLLGSGPGEPLPRGKV